MNEAHCVYLVFFPLQNPILHPCETVNKDLGHRLKGFKTHFKLRHQVKTHLEGLS